MQMWKKFWFLEPQRAMAVSFQKQKGESPFATLLTLEDLLIGLHFPTFGYLQILVSVTMSNVEALLNQVLARLSVIEAKIGGGAGGSSSDAAAPGLPPRIAAYDAYCTAYLDPFVAACTKLGGDAEKAGNNIKEAWQAQRAFLLMATACKEPAPASLPSLLKDLSVKLSASKTLINRNEWENHTKTLSEGISCLNWYVLHWTTDGMDCVNVIFLCLFRSQALRQARP